MIIMKLTNEEQFYSGILTALQILYAYNWQSWEEVYKNCGDKKMLFKVAQKLGILELSGLRELGQKE